MGKNCINFILFFIITIYVNIVVSASHYPPRHDVPEPLDRRTFRDDSRRSRDDQRNSQHGNSYDREREMYERPRGHDGQHRSGSEINKNLLKQLEPLIQNLNLILDSINSLISRYGGISSNKNHRDGYDSSANRNRRGYDDGHERRGDGGRFPSYGGKGFSGRGGPDRNGDVIMGRRGKDGRDDFYGHGSRGWGGGDENGDVVMGRRGRDGIDGQPGAPGRGSIVNGRRGLSDENGDVIMGNVKGNDGIAYGGGTAGKGGEAHAGDITYD